MNTADSKRCPMCGEMKGRTEYFKIKSGKCGPYCKPCSAARKRKGDLSNAELMARVFPEPGKKRCSKCDEIKPLSDYNRRTGRDRAAGQVKPYCKSCEKGMFKSWAVRNGHAQDRTRAEYAAHVQAVIYPTDDTKRCPRCDNVKPRHGFSTAAGKIKVWCRECVGEVRRARYAETREAQKTRRAEWKARNPEAYREYARMGQHRRRARKAALPSTLTHAEWEQILDLYGHRCLCCGTTGQITMDHVVPISKGGGHVADNVQPLCGPCNSSKHAKIIDYRPGKVAA